MSFMGPKAIAVTLVLLMGAVAAYDVKYMLDRRNKKMETPATAHPVDAGVGSGQQNVPAGDSPAQDAEPPDHATPAGTIQQPDAAGDTSAAQLPPVFTMDWVNPFTKEPEATQSDAVAPPTPGAIPQNIDILAAYNPVVSAVLIGSSVKRVVINRQVYVEGSCVSGIGAVVKAVSPAGVELTLGGNSRFFPLSPQLNSEFGIQNSE